MHHDDLRPGVTVCVATHPERQTSGLINRAFASVAAQTMQPSAILVCNDLDRLGAGANRRRLLAMVDTEWIAWCDSDDELMPEHLEKLYRVATETDSIFVFSWFHGPDPLGHFGLPFNPCTPHHTTHNVLVRTDIAQEVGYQDNQIGTYANEDWGFITGVAAIACERGLAMTHLAERTWTYHQHGQNSSGQPGQGDARGA
jgi:glycosyltransferase involved in cell wall biosynthesis